MATRLVHHDDLITLLYAEGGGVGGLYSGEMDGPALLQKLRDSSRIPNPPLTLARSPADLCHRASFVRRLLCPAIGNRVQLPLSETGETADICSPK